MAESLFVKEYDVYNYFRNAGIKTPRFIIVGDAVNPQQTVFEKDEEVVIKGIATDLWHKSDEGALFFEKFNEEKINKIISDIKNKLKDKYLDLNFMVCEKISFPQIKGLPVEAFLSFKRDSLFGMVINFGVGGLYAELWAQQLNDKINQWSLELNTPEDALRDFKNHLIGKIWLGNIRQGINLTNEKVMKNFFKSLWALGKKLENDNIELLETNPIVLDSFGHPVILDGVGLKQTRKDQGLKLNYSYDAFLNPRTIAIAGVSDKPGSFGKKILENILESDISRKDISIIKPGVESFLGVKCYGDLTYLKDQPVDMLILALPAKTTVEMLSSLIEQRSGAQYVYLVAGGIGDGADREGYGNKIKTLLHSKRESGDWTPGIIGPNSLGIVIGTSRINTLFLSPDRLPVNFHKEGNCALVSQSGAFMITRISTDHKLPLKYGFAIGNQLDMKASQILELISHDQQIKVFGFYLEGFEAMDAKSFGKISQKIIESGRYVVVYKGGRSKSGMKAASGHTGAMASDYDLIKTIFYKSGIIMAETIDHFTTYLNVLSNYPNIANIKSIMTITNAGFEAVSCADHLGDLLNNDSSKKLMHVLDTASFTQLLKDHHLWGLVSISNPFDLTPMANEQVFLQVVQLAVKQYDAIILSIVPFTEMLKALKQDITDSFIDALDKIRQDSGRMILIVVDAGELYDNYRDAFEQKKFSVFRTIEKPMMVLNDYFTTRRNIGFQEANRS